MFAFSFYSHTVSGTDGLRNTWKGWQGTEQLWLMPLINYGDGDLQQQNGFTPNKLRSFDLSWENINVLCREDHFPRGKHISNLRHRALINSSYNLFCIQVASWPVLKEGARGAFASLTLNHSFM